GQDPGRRRRLARLREQPPRGGPRPRGHPDARVRGRLRRGHRRRDVARLRPPHGAVEADRPRRPRHPAGHRPLPGARARSALRPAAAAHRPRRAGTPRPQDRTRLLRLDRREAGEELMSEILESYVAGTWTKGAGTGREVLDAVTGEPVTRVSSEGIDMGEVVRHAREVGGPALRALTFPERAAALKAAAGAVHERKDDLYALSAPAGATARDSGFDIAGGAGTAFVHSSLGPKGLPDGKVVVEHEFIQLGKEGV